MKHPPKTAAEAMLKLERMNASTEAAVVKLISRYQAKQKQLQEDCVNALPPAEQEKLRAMLGALGGQWK